MSETLRSLQALARFPFAMRHFRHQHITLDQAHRIVRRRMEQREEMFLDIASRSIYSHPASPYRALLKMAGCEPDDLRTLVKQNGLENALRVLRGQGVYVTFEEFKGRKPLVRGGKTIPIQDSAFDNPLSPALYSGETGGSTGTASRGSSNLDQRLAWAPHYTLTFAAHNVLHVPAALWRGILPDGSGIGLCFQYAPFRAMFSRWFSHLDPHDVKIRYPLMTYYMIAVARMFGMWIPSPEYVPLENALVVARWVHATVKSHGGCFVSVQVSRALRISLAAQQAGLDLTGATFEIAGEPVTPAKVREIEQCGAHTFATYGLSESGRIGMGCVNRLDPSDCHFLHDAFALITHPHRVGEFDVEVPAFNITTLLPETGKIMLNLEVDDYGIVEERHCGCDLEQAGYTTHLREISSYQKLTGEGVTLIGSEMLHILEEVLPARFGGSPLDYQLLEQEDAKGFTRLYLVISPRIEIRDEQQVIEVVLNALRKSSAMANAARTVWQHAGIFQIMRAEPVWTQRGKYLPLRRERAIPQPS